MTSSLRWLFGLARFSCMMITLLIPLFLPRRSRVSRRGVNLSLRLLRLSSPVGMSCEGRIRQGLGFPGCESENKGRPANIHTYITLTPFCSAINRSVTCIKREKYFEAAIFFAITTEIAILIPNVGTAHASLHQTAQSVCQRLHPGPPYYKTQRPLNLPSSSSRREFTRKVVHGNICSRHPRRSYHQKQDYCQHQNSVPFRATKAHDSPLSEAFPGCRIVLTVSSRSIISIVPAARSFGSSIGGPTSKSPSSKASLSVMTGSEKSNVWISRVASMHSSAMAKFRPGHAIQGR